MSVGVLLGRFQPFHQGHLEVVKDALKENSEVLILIGSSQKAEHFSAAERRKMIGEKIKSLKNVRILEVEDPINKDEWPELINKIVNLPKVEKVLYRADNDKITEHMKKLERFGFKLKIIQRKRFIYTTKTGKKYEVGSATEIRDLEKFSFQ